MTNLFHLIVAKFRGQRRSRRCCLALLIFLPLLFVGFFQPYPLWLVVGRTPDFNKQPPLSVEWPGRISRRVHQSWKTSRLPSTRASHWSASWRRCYPDWRYQLWTDADNLQLVRRHYPWLLDTYLGLKRPVEQADIVRYGGIYADLDTLCLRNFTALFGSASIVLGGMDYEKSRSHETVFGTYVQNSLMASKPGHPFWLQLVLRAQWAAQQRSSARGDKSELRPEHITGPLLLLNKLRHYLKENGSFKRTDGAIVIGDLLILPGRYLNPFSWSVNSNPNNCRGLGNMTLHQERLCVSSFPNAYALQFHTQSWLNGRF